MGQSILSIPIHSELIDSVSLQLADNFIDFRIDLSKSEKLNFDAIQRFHAAFISTLDNAKLAMQNTS